jgi:hypothetical protein
MFHLLSYFAALGVNAADSDLAAVPDQEFTRRGGAGGVDHYIFTEQYNLLGVSYNAASAIRARFNVPTWNGFGRHQIFPVSRALANADLGFFNDYRDYPMEIPMDEEVAMEGSNNLGAATENSYGHLWIAGPQWSRNLPKGIHRFCERATYTITAVAQQWTIGALTMAEQLKGGVYAVCGMEVQDAGVQAARLVFVRGNTVNGRRMRPGCIVDEALGNRPIKEMRGGMGVWGRFHSFELPQIEILANAAGASTGEVRLDLVYLGSSAAGM